MATLKSIIDSEKWEKSFDWTGSTKQEIESALYDAHQNSLHNIEVAISKMMVHCPECGGDYVATGLEVGCSCKLKRRIEDLESALHDVLVELKSHVASSVMTRDDHIAISNAELALKRH